MLIWRERPKEESSSSLVTNKLIWYTILFCFSVQVFIQHRRESPCFHLTIYSDFHFPLAAMINDFRRSNISCHSRSFQHRMVLKSIRMEKSSLSRVDVFTNEIDKCCLANCLFVTIFDLTETCFSFQMTNTV